MIPFPDEAAVRSRFLRLDGRHIHLVERGAPSAPTVLFLHGNPTWSFLYRNLLSAATEAGWHAVAPDLPGFGRSDKPRQVEDYSLDMHANVIRSLLGTLDAERWVLVAHDWGGPIGLRAAMRHGTDPAGVVLMNTGTFHDLSLPLSFQGITSSVFDDLFLRRLNGFVEVLLRVGTFQRQRLTPEVMRHYRAPLRFQRNRAGVLAFPRMIPQSPSHENAEVCERIERYLARLTCPVMVLNGRHDPVFGPDYGLRMAGVCRNAVQRTIGRAGHYLQEDRPRTLRRMLGRFIDRLDPT